MTLKLQIEELRAYDKVRQSFLKWQCRVRQIAMREHQGRPDASITPEIRLCSEAGTAGYIITLIHKLPKYSATAEFRHMAKKTFDPLQKREQAIQFLSSSYYQKANEFSDIFTATFAPRSKGAEQMHNAGACIAIFEAYSKRFELKCKIWKLGKENQFYEATMAHNSLFNPNIEPETIVLGFEPNWKESFASK